MDLLTRSLIDLLYELRNVPFPLTIGGGFGLFLKRLDRDARGDQTLYRELPFPRSTNDLDLFVRVEVLADLERMRELARAIDRLGYKPVEQAKFLQWKKTVAIAGIPQEVKIDFLVGPLGDFLSKLRVKDPRVRPKGELKLHAYRVEEALRIEEEPHSIVLEGERTDGEPYRATVCVPHAFPYLMMKLSAFADRKQDAETEFGRHHALDVYTIVGLLTEREYEQAKELGTFHRDNPHVTRIRSILAEDFSTATALGILRLQEHPLYRPEFRVADMAAVLREIFQAPN